MTRKDEVLFSKVKDFVNNTAKNGKMADFYNTLQKHFDRTVYWLLKLDPEATLAEHIAAYSHDIERSYTEDIKIDKSNRDRKTIHQEVGGEIMRKFLKKQGVDESLQNEVKKLISNHEVGGNTKQNNLKDADSISFLENNVDLFLNVLLEKRGYKSIREKFDWMFNRITSDKAQKLARPYYQVAIRKLEQTK